MSAYWSEPRPAGWRPTRCPRAGLLASLLFCALVMPTSGCDPYSGHVVRVFDGDSFVMRDADGADLEVRLFGIDAPERHQPWSGRSRQALERLVNGHPLRFDIVTEDRYGRVVATVFRASDGMDVNAEMVRQGHAWVYRRYTDDPYLIRLEEQARSAGRGLWGLPAGERIPPWRWRSEHRRPAGGEQDG